MGLSRQIWLIYFISLCISLGTVTGASDKDCSLAADVVFVLDASESIFDDDFIIQMDFVINITRGFYLNQTGGVVVGAVVYSSSIGDVIPLTSFKTQSELEVEIRNFFHLKDGTRTSLGVEWMRTIFRDGGRDGVRRIGIVITDGRSINKADTLLQSQYARDENITMIAVGVGIEIDFTELQGISSGQEFLFQVQNYENLGNLALNMTTTVCPEKPKKEIIQGCRGVSDVFFVIDGSESIFDEDFELEINFVKDVTKELYINGTDGFIVGALVYSSAISSEIHYQPVLSTTQLIHALGSAWRIKAGTQTDLGLRRARGIIQWQGRLAVRQVVVVITDGRSKNTTATAIEAGLLRDAGVEIIALGIGPLVDSTELYNIASNPEYVFSLDSFDDMANYTSNITALLCPQLDTIASTTVQTPETTSDNSACAGCNVVNGVGYNPHPSRCDWYTQCYPADLGEFRNVFRPCPPGSFWQQSALTCNRPAEVNCPYDLCNSSRLEVDSVTFPGSCRAYWECNNGRTVAASCCGRFQRFVEGPGCLDDFSCDESCPFDQAVPAATACHLEEHDTDRHKYYMYEWGVRREFSCAPGTVYSFGICGCDIARDASVDQVCEPDLYLPFGDFIDYASGNWINNQGAVIRTIGGAVGGTAAYFDGNSRVLVPRFSSHDFRSNVLIKLRYLREGDSTGRQEALVTNAECQNTPSIAVYVDREAQTEGAILRTDNDHYTSETFNSISGWKEVSYSYDGEYLVLATNEETDGVNAQGNIQVVHSALHIGDGAGFANFRGYIDEVYVYLSCRP